MGLRTTSLRPTHVDPPQSASHRAQVDAAARAFHDDWEAKNRFFENSPIAAFLTRHEEAGSPNELTITGVADVKVTLGDLRALVRLLR